MRARARGRISPSNGTSAPGGRSRSWSEVPTVVPMRSDRSDARAGDGCHEELDARTRRQRDHIVLAGAWFRSTHAGLTSITVDDGSRVAPESLSSRSAKRALDIGVAGVLLLALVPVIVVAALAVKLESSGPVFYRAARVGKGGRRLAVLKFRKMRAGASGTPLTLAGDARFTRIGRFLAATHIDEIPQLWQVLAGQMSLIGPRPEDARFVELHREEFERILKVRPGISGWTQLVFIDETRLIGSEDAMASYVSQLLPRKVEFDLLYSSKRRFVHDVKLLLWTPLVMMSRFEVVFLPESREFRLVRRPAHARTDIPLLTDSVGETTVPTPRAPLPSEQT
jgi:lipopolysaccharide/colanic/teichoic acid biosynthesis glycosyltransferase